jgi:hypothetical protein
MPALPLIIEVIMNRYPVSGESHVESSTRHKRRFKESTALLPRDGQTHRRGYGSRHHPGAGVLAAVELGGGTSFHISALDILAGPRCNNAHPGSVRDGSANRRAQATIFFT